MDAEKESEPTKNRTTVERKSERELVVTRTFDAPARIVFKAWTTPELFRRWWVPKSMGWPCSPARWISVWEAGTVSCSTTRHERRSSAVHRSDAALAPSSGPMTKVARGSVTTVTLEEKGGKTLLVMQRALSLEGSSRCRRLRGVRRDGRDVGQLDELLVTLGASVGSTYR